MAAEIPLELTQGGSVAQRQTTFWDLTTRDAKARFRAHFDGKVEFSFAGRSFDGALLSEGHPLLLDHVQPTEDLLISSPARAPADVLAALRDLTVRFFNGWRSLDRYLNSDYSPERVLSNGSGMLLRGPSSFVAACRLALADFQLRLDPPLPTRPIDRQLQALILGRSFVVAKNHTFERI